WFPSSTSKAPCFWRSITVATWTSPAIPKLFQVGGNRDIQLRGLGLLFAQGRGELLQLLLERLAVVFLRFRADVAGRRERVAVLAHLLKRNTLAETRNVCVLARVLHAAPGVVRVRDASDVLVRQLAMRPIHHAP